jgi:hypothetical protein
MISLIGRSSIVATLEGESLVYCAFPLISCQPPRPSLGTWPGWLGETQAVTVTARGARPGPVRVRHPHSLAVARVPQPPVRWSAGKIPTRSPDDFQCPFDSESTSAISDDPTRLLSELLERSGRFRAVWQHGITRDVIDKSKLFLTTTQVKWNPIGIGCWMQYGSGQKRR